ncbi:uncharacterized protein LOC117816242 [Notolabrus celidotus]|uniref:uncharacterized protein LOC117816242 n=1 Tax=Notolabrus celidotus TaxID=1203425 RepID=UPI00148FBD83|nr:uncharacterized protein LOC117816242 [Notolabrus celidotus]
MHVGGIEEILEVFLPPPDYTLSRGQQLPIHTVNSANKGPLPLPKPSDSLPEPLRGRLKVFLHGLTKPLPRPSFRLANRPGRRSLGLPVPVSCLRSPTSQPRPVGLLLQLDGTLHLWCPPAGSGITATTGTNSLATAAPDSRLSNGNVEPGPFRLHVPRHPRNAVKALPEVGVENQPNRVLRQTFPADPHCSFGSARSVWHPPPPPDPTHHQVVIS